MGAAAMAVAQILSPTITTGVLAWKAVEMLNMMEAPVVAVAVAIRMAALGVMTWVVTRMMVTWAVVTRAVVALTCPVAILCDNGTEGEACLHVTRRTT